MNNSIAFRLKMAKQKAEAFLREEKLLETFPIDLFAIAASRNITVQAKPDTEPGVSGMLLRHGNNFGILYATHIDNIGFQRFSIGHELAHYFLDGHMDHVIKDGLHTSQAGFVSADPYEREADSFAAGLLLPASPLKKLIRLHDPGMALIDKAVDDFKMSMTATSIRYSELTGDAVAVIMSTDQVIDYCFLSEAMKTLPQLNWLRKGSAVPSKTATSIFSSDPENVRRGERIEAEIDVRDWLGGTKKAMVSEEVVGLGTYGKTLTVLSSKYIGNDIDDSDEDEEEQLIESWTPRFHR